MSLIGEDNEMLAGVRGAVIGTGYYAAVMERVTGSEEPKRLRAVRERR